MARKKNIMLKDELIKLEQEVAEAEAKIKELTDKKKELEELIKKKPMEALHKAVVESGKTIDEAIALINDGQAEQEVLEHQDKEIDCFVNPEEDHVKPGITHITFFYEQLNKRSQRIYDAILKDFWNGFPKLNNHIVLDGENIPCYMLTVDLSDTPIVLEGMEVTEEGELTGKTGAVLRTEAAKALSPAFYAVQRDHPELSWLRGSRNYCSVSQRVITDVNTDNSGNRIGTIVLRTMPVKITISSNALIPDNNRTTYEKALTKARSEITLAIRDKDSRLDTLRAIHDWVCDHIQYELDHLQDGTPSGYGHTVYSGLVDRKTDCGGFANAFKALADSYEIPCVVVVGWYAPHEEKHTWNLVKMDDEEWYGVDCTADHSRTENSHTYKLFLVGSRTPDISGKLFSEKYIERPFWNTKYGHFVYPAIAEERYTEEKAPARVEITFDVPEDAIDHVSNKYGKVIYIDAPVLDEEQVPSTRTVQYYAHVYDKNGNELPDYPVFWIASRRGTDIDQNGLLTITPEVSGDKGSWFFSMPVHARVPLADEAIVSRMWVRIAATPAFLNVYRDGERTENVLIAQGGRLMLTAEVLDCYSRTQDAPSVKWRIEHNGREAAEINGVSVKDGVVSVTKDAAEGQVTLVVSFGSLEKRIPVVIKR